MKRTLLRPKKGELLRTRKRLYGFLGSQMINIEPGTVVMFLEKLKQISSTRRYSVLHKGRIIMLIFLYCERISDDLEKVLWL